MAKGKKRAGLAVSRRGRKSQRRNDASISGDRPRREDGTGELRSDKSDEISASLARLVSLAERSYKEVLDATKHQDDKVGRFLTAIAFLTTGTIALIAQDDSLREDFVLANGDAHPLLAWSTGGYFVLTIASVALLLLCLSVPVRLPQTQRDPMRDSRLFYSYIAARPVRAWTHEWVSRCADCLEFDIAHDYIRESHNLAERTTSKYRHSYEASWLFVLALLFLGVSVYLKILVYFGGPGTSSVAFEQGPVCGLAAIVLVHALLQIYTRAVHDTRSMQKMRDENRADASETSKQIRRNRESYRQRRWTGILGLSVIGYLALILVDHWPADRSDRILWSFLLVLVFVGGPTTLVRDRWDDEREREVQLGRPRDWVLISAIVLLSTVAVGLSAEFGGIVRVVAVLMPAVAMCAVNAMRPAYAQRRTRKVQRDSKDFSDDPDGPRADDPTCPVCKEPTRRPLSQGT